MSCLSLGSTQLEQRLCYDVLLRSKGKKKENLRGLSTLCLLKIKIGNFKQKGASGRL